MNDKFEVEFIDSLGVDQSAIRPDIMAHVFDARTLVLLCSRFGSAPDAAIHELLKHVNATDVDPSLLRENLIASSPSWRRSIVGTR